MEVAGLYLRSLRLSTFLAFKYMLAPYSLTILSYNRLCTEYFHLDEGWSEDAANIGSADAAVRVLNCVIQAEARRLLTSFWCSP